MMHHLVTAGSLPRPCRKRYDPSVVKYVVLCIWLVASACGHQSPLVIEDNSDSSKPRTSVNELARYQAAFALTWNGARIGYAQEHIRDNRLHRREEITVRRGVALVQLITIIDIKMDAAWRASQVKVERRVGATITRGHAERVGNKWRVKFGEEPVRLVDGAAIPLELLPLLLARKQQRKFQGAVLLSGYGFATATMAVNPRGRKRVMTTLTTGAGTATTLIDLTDLGTVARVHGEVGAVKIGNRELGDAFRPPELVDNSSLSVTGTPGRYGAVQLAIRNAPTTLPPSLPGQKVQRGSRGWRVTLLPGDRNGLIAKQPGANVTLDPKMRRLARAIIHNASASTRRAKVVALTRATRGMLMDDMSTPVHEAGAALALGRGDCTSHAALLSSLATAVGIPTRLVTGFRLDGRRLIRHRWVIANIGAHWMAVDPTYGEAPARPRLLGLAVHDSSASQLAIVDDMAFAKLRNVNVYVAP